MCAPMREPTDTTIEQISKGAEFGGKGRQSARQWLRSESAHFGRENGRLICHMLGAGRLPANNTARTHAAATGVKRDFDTMARRLDAAGIRDVVWGCHGRSRTLSIGTPMRLRKGFLCFCPHLFASPRARRGLRRSVFGPKPRKFAQPGRLFLKAGVGVPPASSACFCAKKAATR